MTKHLFSTLSLAVALVAGSITGTIAQTQPKPATELTRAANRAPAR
jgi:hypothetical protein